MSDRIAARTILESFFTPEYLFHEEHLLFRSLVSPPVEDNHGDQEKPPVNPLRILLQFREVRQALQPFANSEDEAALLNAAAEVLADSEVVEVAVAVTPAGGWTVRRRAWLRDEEDPIHRTVVLRPVHADATEDEVLEFLRAHQVRCVGRSDGAESPHNGVDGVVHVEKITFQRRILSNLFMSSLSAKQQAQQEEDSKYRSTAWIVVRSDAEANFLCQRKYSFGTLIPRENENNVANGSVTSLAKYFFPKVSVTSAKKFQEQQEDTAQQHSNDQLKRNIIRAQASLAPTAVGGKVRWMKDSTLVAHGVPPSATWSTIKSTVGEWVSQKNSIRKVFVKPETRTAYVFCHTAAFATEILTAFYRGAPHRANVCETLKLVDDADEADVVMQFGQNDDARNHKRNRE